MGAIVSKDKGGAQPTLKQWVGSDKFKDQVKMALPKHMSPDRYVRVLLTILNKTPKLMQCKTESVLQAMVDCSSTGLEPDGRRAHLIPYKDQCKLVIDYKGLIELAKRSGEVATWRAEMVCENDVFTYVNGVVHHEINFKEARGEPYAVFSHVYRKDGVHEYDVMTIDEVNLIKERSDGYKAFQKGWSKTNPWQTDFNEMAKKTVIKRHSKRLTLSSEFQNAVQKDNDHDFSFDDQVTPTVPLDDMMPTRMSESSVSDSSTSNEVEKPEVDDTDDSNVVKEPEIVDAIDPNENVSHSELTKIFSAVEANPNTNNNILMAHTRDVYGLSKISDLKKVHVDAVLKFIESYEPKS